MIRKNKKVYVIIVLLIGIILLITTSFALWQITLKQYDENKLTTSCFRIKFKDQDSINLTDAYPMSDEEGKKLKPYIFTITNTCNTHAAYQINLEILNDTTLENISLIKTSFNEKNPRILTDYLTVDKTLENSTTSKRIENGYIFPNEEKTFTLNLWIGEKIENQDDIINKMFNSKVTIITSFLKEKPSYASVITNCSNNGYTTTKCMLDNSKYDTENLVLDSTSDNNLRYIGKNPNNYIDFNNEKWRIIGVMNNVEDITGKTSSRLKIVRDESIGEYSWDSSASNINYGLGINEWSQADLMKLMNPGFENETIGGSLYYNSKNGKCYTGQNSVSSNCDFTNNGLKNDAKEKIDTVIWNTGSLDGRTYVHTNTNAIQMYSFERSQNTGKIASGNRESNDTVERTTKWIGKIGVIYPSDYGYATSGSDKELRGKCLNTSLYSWPNLEECNSNNWLIKESDWTITPAANTSNNVDVFCYLNSGNTHSRCNAIYRLNVRPSIYLKPTTKIISGIGTKENSFKID